MKLKGLIFTTLLFSIGTLSAQFEMDAYGFARKDITGTARTMGMGGAFGALGDDVSAIAINPAGIGVYKRSEVVTTLNLQKTTINTQLGTQGKEEKGKTKFSFDNIAFVSVYNLNDETVPTINFGFSYNRLKSYDREYFAAGTPRGAESMSDYMAYRADNEPEGYLGASEDNWRYSDWLAVLGYNSGLIVKDPFRDGYVSSTSPLKRSDGTLARRGLAIDNQKLFVREKGSAATYDFNVGTTISDIVSLGLTLSLTDLSHSVYSEFEEVYSDGEGYGGYALGNNQKTEGSGIQIATGIIFKPIKELRFGIAYHSPTWYNMTVYQSAFVDYNLSNFVYYEDTSIPEKYRKSGSVDSFDGYDNEYDYSYRTPDKWTFSAAALIGTYAKVTVDYDITNYGNMKFNDPDSPNYYDATNKVINARFKAASSVRLGVEGTVTKQFSIRAGMAWQESPAKPELKNRTEEILTTSVPDYVIEGDKTMFTYGMGYRFTRNFYTDIAFAFTNQTDDLYMYDWSADKYTMKTNKVQGLLTFGYRF